MTAPPSAIITPARSIELSELDRTEWWDWWEYNKERFLGLDDVLARLHPITPRGDDLVGPDLGRRAGLDARRVYGELVPALVSELEAEDNILFRRRALLALGRIGEAPKGFESTVDSLSSVIASFLSSEQMGVAEAAVVALGALETVDGVRILCELLEDGEPGQARVGRNRVPVRMRALAAYGLGVSGAGELPGAVRSFAVHSLVGALSAEGARYPDVQAAAVIAIGLIPLTETEDAGEHAPPSSCIPAQARFLLSLLDEEQPRMVRNHAPTAVARLLEASEHAEELHSLVIERLLEALDRGESVGVRRSSVIGLGLLADADNDPLDVRVREELFGLLSKGDLPSRSFAAISLAQIASREGTGENPNAAVATVSKSLTRHLVRGKSFERPWAALALGVMGFQLREKGSNLPKEAADALRGELARERNSIESSAMALAAGMVGDPRAYDAVLERVEEERADDFMSYFSVGLGLLRQTAGIEALTELMDEADHRPMRTEYTALGRALIGDMTLVDELVGRLDDCNCSVSVRGVGRALAWTADDRGILPLLALVEDRELPASTRANAVEALGRIADRSNVAWDVRISRGLNYLDAPTSLTDPSGFGILDTF